MAAAAATGVRAGGPDPGRHRRAAPGRWRRQAASFGDGTDADVVAFAEDALEAAVQVFPRPRRAGARPARLVVDKVEDVTPATWSSSSACRCTADDRRGTRCRGRSWCPSCRRTGRCSSSLLRELRGARVTLRVPQRGDKRALLETVARIRAAGLHPAQAQAATDLTAPVAGAGRAAGRARLDTAPLRIECFTSRTCRAPTWSPRWWCSRTGCRARSEYRGSPIRGTERRRQAHRGRATCSGSTRRLRRRMARYLDERIDTGEEADDTGDDEGDPAAVPQAAEPGRPRRPAAAQVRRTRRICSSSTAAPRRSPRGRGRAGRSSWHRGRRAVRAGQAAGGGLAARRGPAGDPGRARPRRSTCCSGYGTRRTGSRSPTTGRSRSRAMTTSALDGVPGAGRDPEEGASDSVRLAEAAPRGVG
jgi:excinuclease ABC subunit C